jgi:hypothetical protein
MLELKSRFVVLAVVAAAVAAVLGNYGWSPSGHLL